MSNQTWRVRLCAHLPLHWQRIYANAQQITTLVFGALGRSFRVFRQQLDDAVAAADHVGDAAAAATAAAPAAAPAPAVTVAPPAPTTGGWDDDGAFGAGAWGASSWDATPSTAPEPAVAPTAG